MKTRTLCGAVLFILTAFVCAGAATAALNTPVWPWGTNPKTQAPINGFCDAQQAILDCSVIELLPFFPHPMTVFFSPTTGDINGVSYMVKEPLTFGISGNDLVDCSIELKLIEEVLRNTAFNIPAHGSYTGLSYQKVRACFEHNDAQFAWDVGSYWPVFGHLIDGLPQVFLGHMCIGDGDATFSEGTAPNFNRVDFTGSAGLIKALLYLMGDSIHISMINLANYDRMPEFFSKDGDADGDGYTNDEEYRCSGAAEYVAAALNPAIHDPCDRPHFTWISGGGWHEQGSPLILSVLVNWGGLNFSYSWFKDGTAISGASDMTYTIEDPTSEDSGVYSCVATDEEEWTFETGPIVVTILPQNSLSTSGIAGVVLALSAMLVFGAWTAARSTRKA